MATKAASSETRIVLLDNGSPADVFELIELGDVILVRSPFLFELGEELALQIDGTRKVTVRVKAHRSDGVTELEPQ